LHSALSSILDSKFSFFQLATNFLLQPNTFLHFMRKLLLFLSVYLWTFGALFAQSDYYWYRGRKIPVSANEQKKLVIIDNQQAADKKTLLNTPGVQVKSSSQSSTPGSLVPYKNFKPESREIAIVESDREIRKMTGTAVVYEAPFYVNSAGEEAPLTDQFYVKLKNKGDVKLLEQLAKEHSVVIKGHNTFMPLWYTLGATSQSKGNALDLANVFYESGFFAASEPEFLFEIKTNCAYDPLFTSQWGLLNTGASFWTAGIDIKACGAWTCTKGDSAIIVAVVDDGVQLDHPDLPNMTALSYDAHTGTSPSVLRGSHGTPCAGIIGAAHSGIANAGVAPNVKLMSVSIAYGSGGSTPAAFADAINFAWQNGADVISNSWYYDAWWTTVIEDAIADAIEYGRGGKGSTVVFSAGNTDGAITNPAGLNPDILVVGAGSPCGERKSPSSCDGESWWGGSYGTQLDVTAPGVLVPTTTIYSGYTYTFNGTSAAAPHVSGVAALLYSLNPDLTREDLVDIIEQTAQKVGSYTYSTTTGRPNGNWNNEMGYGLIDAEAAVNLARTNLLTLFGVPAGSAITNGFRQFSYVHTLGCGGPNLSNVFNSVFNWWGGASGLYQFTLETTDGNPRYYTNITDYATYALHTSTPEITITSGIGFTGLAGDYWVNLDGSNVVLVEKSGDYALYFSNSATPPAYRLGAAQHELTYVSSGQADVIAAPNPFTTETMLMIPENMGHSTIMVSNVEGQTIETLSGSGSVKLGASYPVGLYLVRIIGQNGVKQASFIKQ